MGGSISGFAAKGISEPPCPGVAVRDIPRFQSLSPCTGVSSSARVLKTYAELPKVLTKSELIEQVSELLKLPNGKAEQIVNCIFDSMVNALQEEDGIEIRGFGSFTVRQYKSYDGRNPRTGETVHVAPKRLPFFKVGKDLRERVNRGASRAARQVDGAALARYEQVGGEPYASQAQQVPEVREDAREDATAGSSEASPSHPSHSTASGSMPPHASSSSQHGGRSDSLSTPGMSARGFGPSSDSWE